MKKMIALTTSVVILFFLTFSSCLKINLKNNISPDYKENYARFAESLYTHVKDNNDSLMVSEEKIDQDASSIDLNFGSLLNENFLEVSTKPSATPKADNSISTVLKEDMKTKDQTKFIKDVEATINLKDSFTPTKPVTTPQLKTKK